MNDDNLSSRQKYYFISEYSRTPNDVLVSQLNEMEPTSQEKVTLKCVVDIARKYNLKKDPRKMHSSKAEQLIKSIGKDFHDYSGKPQKEIRRVVPTDCSVIRLRNRENISSLKKACSTYNKKEGVEKGIKVTGTYDKEALLAILIAEPISRTSPCTSQSSPEEAQCVPP